MSRSRIAVFAVLVAVAALLAGSSRGQEVDATSAGRVADDLAALAEDLPTREGPTTTAAPAHDDLDRFVNALKRLASSIRAGKTRGETQKQFREANALRRQLIAHIADGSITVSEAQLAWGQSLFRSLAAYFEDTNAAL